MKAEEFIKRYETVKANGELGGYIVCKVSTFKKFATDLESQLKEEKRISGLIEDENKRLKDQFCRCTEDQTTGWIETAACNICGKIIEDELLSNQQ